jgi:hypothetical protein
MMRSYEQYEKAASDWTSGINGAKQERSWEIAKKFKKMGISPEQISEGTGLSVSEIQKL